MWLVWYRVWLCTRMWFNNNNRINGLMVNMKKYIYLSILNEKPTFNGDWELRAIGSVSANKSCLTINHQGVWQ